MFSVGLVSSFVASGDGSLVGPFLDPFHLNVCHSSPRQKQLLYRGMLSLAGACTSEPELL